MLFILFLILFFLVLSGWIYVELEQKNRSVRLTVGVLNMACAAVFSGVILYNFGKVEPSKERSMMQGSLRNIAGLADRKDTAAIRRLIADYERTFDPADGYRAAADLYNASCKATNESSKP